MEYILKSRARGKTYDLIRKSYETGAVIVCATEMSAKYVLELAHTMDVTIPVPISCSKLIKNQNCLAGKTILIDELQIVLQILLGSYVEAVTDTPTRIILDVDEIKR